MCAKDCFSVKGNGGGMEGCASDPFFAVVGGERERRGLRQVVQLRAPGTLSFLSGRRRKEAAGRDSLMRRKTAVAPCPCNARQVEPGSVSAEVENPCSSETHNMPLHIWKRTYMKPLPTPLEISATRAMVFASLLAEPFETHSFFSSSSSSFAFFFLFFLWLSHPPQGGSPRCVRCQAARASPPGTGTCPQAG